MLGQALAGPRSRQPAARRPMAVVLVSLLCVFAHAGALLHMVLVRHQTCVEHGELVHAPSASAPSSARDRAPVGPLVSAAPDATEGESDHCLLLAVARAQGAMVPDQAIGDLDRTATTSLPTTDVPAPFGRERLRLAPKTSPPSACA